MKDRPAIVEDTFRPIVEKAMREITGNRSDPPLKKQ